MSISQLYSFFIIYMLQDKIIFRLFYSGFCSVKGLESITFVGGTLIHDLVKIEMIFVS